MARLITLALLPSRTQRPSAGTNSSRARRCSAYPVSIGRGVRLIGFGSLTIKS